MVNPDCARSMLEKMCQKEVELVAQYHMCLQLQVAKCGFMNPDDVIRSKILQTMQDKKLRWETMVKRYTLQQLLEHTATKKTMSVYHLSGIFSSFFWTNGTALFSTKETKQIEPYHLISFRPGNQQSASTVFSQDVAQEEACWNVKEKHKYRPKNLIRFHLQGCSCVLKCPPTLPTSKDTL